MAQRKRSGAPQILGKGKGRGRGGKSSKGLQILPARSSKSGQFLPGGKGKGRRSR